MPLFDYACAACAHRFEALVFDRDDEPGACPECGSGKVRRDFSVPAAPQLKVGAPAGGACRSEGPPCGPACGRFRGD